MRAVGMAVVLCAEDAPGSLRDVSFVLRFARQGGTSEKRGFRYSACAGIVWQDGMHDYTGLALKHITTGHLVAQIATLAFSNYASRLQ